MPPLKISFLPGFRRKEFRGKLAIAITANFINRNTTAEAKVEEISGVAFIFNQKFFQELREATGWCQCLHSKKDRNINTACDLSLGGFGQGGSSVKLLCCLPVCFFFTPVLHSERYAFCVSVSYSGVLCPHCRDGLLLQPFPLPGSAWWCLTPSAVGGELWFVENLTLGVECVFFFLSLFGFEVNHVLDRNEVVV